MRVDLGEGAEGAGEVEGEEGVEGRWERRGRKTGASPCLWGIVEE